MSEFEKLLSVKEFAKQLGGLTELKALLATVAKNEANNTKRAKSRDRRKGEGLFVLTQGDCPQLTRYTIDHETKLYYYTTPILEDLSPLGSFFRVRSFFRVKDRFRFPKNNYWKVPFWIYLSYDEACQHWKKRVRDVRHCLCFPDSDEEPLTKLEQDKLAELSALQDLLTDEAPADELRKLGFLKWFS